MATRVHDQRQERDEPAAELERTATEWFFRRDAGLSPEEENAFQGWLRADARHGRAWAEIEATWRNLGEAEPHVRRAIPGEAGRPAETRSVVRAWLPALAAAAALVVAAIGWRVASRLPDAGLPAVTFAEQAATEIGGMRKLDLPDGSFVTLNTNSAVDIQFTAAERRVRLLRGEAHFTIAPNPRRPFIAETSGVAVRAVGTAFNVRRDAGAVEVLVTEGKVRVDDIARGASLLAVSTASVAPTGASAEADEPVLAAGQKVVISVKGDEPPAPATFATLAASEIEQTLAWRQRRLVYAEAPLSEIVADFNRYNQHRLVIPDARLASRRFGGSFPASDYGSFVQLLESTFGVVVERRERETVLRLP